MALLLFPALDKHRETHRTVMFIEKSAKVEILAKATNTV